MKVKCVVLEDGSQYDIHALTPAMQGELVQDLAGRDTNTVLKQADYKSVKKVK